MKSRIPQIATKLDETLAEALEEALAPVVEDAKAAVPKDSRDLMKSIHVDHRDDDTVAVVAGNSDAWYGHIIEFGSVQPGPQGAARPFLVPAWERHKLAVQKKVALAMKKLTETGRGNI